MTVRGHEGHGPAPGHRRHRSGEEILAHHEHPRRAGTAKELMRRKEDRILIGGVHGHVGSGGGVIPKHSSPGLVDQGADALRIAAHPGHVRSGGEAREEPGLQRLQQLSQGRLIEGALGAQGHMAKIDRAFPPGQLIGVVLKGAEDDHGAGRPRGPVAEAQAINQPVDRARGAGAAKDHRMLGTRAHRRANLVPRVFSKPMGLATGESAFRVGVGVEGQHPGLEEVLNGLKGAPRGRIVCVDQGPGPKGRGHGGAIAEDALAQPGKKIVSVFPVHGAGPPVYGESSVRRQREP